MSNPIVTQVVEKIANLPDDLKRKVLEFVQRLTTSAKHGVPGRQLLRFAGTIPYDDVQLMRKTIEDGCEQVDLNEW